MEVASFSVSYYKCDLYFALRGTILKIQRFFFSSKKIFRRCIETGINKMSQKEMKCKLMND